MEVVVPIRLNYLTGKPVPIPEIIASLQSMEVVLTEAAQNLPFAVQGLKIQKTEVGIQEITTGSLREYFILALVFSFQEDLRQTIPPMFEDVTGMEIPANWEPIVVLVTLIAVFYGAGFVKDMISDRVRDTPVRQTLDGLIEDLAKRSGRSPAEIRKYFDDRYKPKSKIKQLAANAVSFFRPAKSQSNAPIEVGDQLLSEEVVRDAPESYVYEEAAKTETAQPYYNQDLEIHQMDRDRDKSGWAAIPLGLHDKRLPMKLMDGVSPDQLWQQDRIKGDIMLMSRRVGLEFIPSEIHLMKIE